MKYAAERLTVLLHQLFSPFDEQYREPLYNNFVRLWANQPAEYAEQLATEIKELVAVSDDLNSLIALLTDTFPDYDKQEIRAVFELANDEDNFQAQMMEAIKDQFFTPDEEFIAIWDKANIGPRYGFGKNFFSSN